MNYIKYRFFILILVLSIKSVHSQIEAVPINYYGTWDRGESINDYSDPKYDYILGMEVDDTWANLQPNASIEPDFSIFQIAIDKALRFNKIVKFSINVGPESPMWLYQNGVPLVLVNPNLPKNNHLSNAPYYLNQKYQDYYFDFIRKFSLFLRNQPQEKFDRIAFVQVKTGATGDEEPYKGVPFDTNYNISDTAWQNFRILSFNKFKEYFNDVADRKIVLTFNNVDPEKQKRAYNWVINDIDRSIGFGIKGGAYNRGHHLSDEKTFKKQWVPFLVNPKDIKIFSASEMDQSWTKDIFKINTELGFYWAMLGALNTGLSSYNVAKSAVIYAYDHEEIRDIYKMFNKFSQQVYPKTATAALAVFHEGLDAADKDKFPEDIYGKANQGNESRYLAICNDPIYKNRGAKMGDTFAATKGQVFQRESQVAYNDAGWDIEDGNYERFLTQINPNETSIGLFHVRGEINTNSSKYDRFARSFDGPAKSTMYFKFDDEMFIDDEPESLTFKIIWLDKTAGSTWSVKYKNKQGQITSAIDVVGTGSNNINGEWKEVSFVITDMLVNAKGAMGSDFTLVNTDNIDDVFHGIEVDIQRKKQGLSVHNHSLKEFNLFPNPTNDIISWNSNLKFDKIKVISVTGAILLEINNPNTNSIDLRNLNSGMYFVHFFQEKNQNSIKKIIKM
ncbi:T9SS type A sorting domain-containing protein [Polaribacter sp. BAL334]|uniref:T9SS type A sorting domain-containing protein n=1 Tax=Polaribacter sp. BAL334 TaxID=1708178 RepID=UPI0018D2214E|nr:T9SS type A sorting domain-containing protein [Polaribacter sp. BAL334]MBG7613111.1 T9SS type A sorting domain-containing protein [Polaribacter sp. BAL334]